MPPQDGTAAGGDASRTMLSRGATLMRAGG